VIRAPVDYPVGNEILEVLQIDLSGPPETLAGALPDIGHAVHRQIIQHLEETLFSIRARLWIKGGRHIHRLSLCST
jgi:hypothetical protein